MVHQIPTGDSGHYYIFEIGDVYRVNPFQLYRDHNVRRNMIIEMDILRAKKYPLTITTHAILLKRALKFWEEYKLEALNTELPDCFIKVLQSKSKKEQIRLLKGANLTTNQMLKWIFVGWSDFNLAFSQFHVEHLSKDIPRSEMPRIVNVKDEKVEKHGKTSLSDKQLKHAVEYRHVVIAKFLENDNEWHCLFITYDSIKGKEKWKDGQPHFHYISDKFGISRQEVESQLRSKNYKLNSLPHIDLLDYR